MRALGVLLRHVISRTSWRASLSLAGKKVAAATFFPASDKLARPDVLGLLSRKSLVLRDAVKHPVLSFTRDNFQGGVATPLESWNEN